MSPYDDSVDLRSFTVGHDGLITRPVSGNSFNWVSLRAGNDTIEGNGSTWISIPANDSNSLVAGRKQGVNIDLSATPDANGFITLNLSHLQSYAPGAPINMGSAVKIKGISRLTGTPLDDTLKGGMAINDDFENFRGGAGNDLIDGVLS